MCDHIHAPATLPQEEAAGQVVNTPQCGSGCGVGKLLASGELEFPVHILTELFRLINSRVVRSGLILSDNFSTFLCGIGLFKVV
jgi:hypothetical protein